MKPLVLIPARGGSKGVPKKNIKLLNGKPLIGYSIEVARGIAPDEDICVSTDDSEIIALVESEFNLPVPFIRPDELSSDQAGMREVMLHAVKHFEEKGIFHDCLVLLQPTSPFRTTEQVTEALSLFDPETDLILSVFETKSNPYYILMEETEEGWLKKSKEGHFARRQDMPKVFEINGAIYVIDIDQLKDERYPSISAFPRIKKYVMPTNTSVDIDTPLDWEIAEYLMKKKLC